MSKCIVITGAGSGLGRALARRLAADGATVVLLGRTRSKLDSVAQEIGAPSFAVECDVASPDSVRTAFAQIAARHDRIDVLINNAAVFQPFWVKDATDEQISASLNTNLAGPIYCSRAAIPMMANGSHIINISSGTVQLSHAMFALYQSSKMGLERFTDSLHQELMADGIRVTMARAGQMTDEDFKWDMDPELMGEFVAENLKIGLDLRNRPISPYTAAAELIRTLINLPPEFHVPHIVLEARRTEAT